MEMTETLYANPFDDIALHCQRIQASLPRRKARFPGFESPVGDPSNRLIMTVLGDEYTSSCIVRILLPVANAPIPVPEPPIHEQVRSILVYFGLSKSDLAKILGITRPTLYAWLDEKIEPKSDNIVRLFGIYSIMDGSHKANGMSLFHAYVERPVADYSISLIEALSEPDMDVSLIRAMVEKIRAMTEARNSRIGKGEHKIAKASLSANKDDQILECNLIAIGPGD